jgi:hypothetical protein
MGRPDGPEPCAGNVAVGEAGIVLYAFEQTREDASADRRVLAWSTWAAPRTLDHVVYHASDIKAGYEQGVTASRTAAFISTAAPNTTAVFDFQSRTFTVTDAASGLRGELPRDVGDGALVHAYSPSIGIARLERGGSFTMLVSGESTRVVDFAVDRRGNDTLVWMERGAGDTHALWTSPLGSAGTVQRRRVATFSNPRPLGGSQIVADGGTALVGMPRCLLNFGQQRRRVRHSTRLSSRSPLWTFSTGARRRRRAVADGL